MKEVDYKGAHGNFCSDEVFPDFLTVCENSQNCTLKWMNFIACKL